MPLLELSIELGELSPDAAEAACFATGALSVSFSDAVDEAVLEPRPGELRLWRRTRLQALYGCERAEVALILALADAMGIAPTRLGARMVADRAIQTAAGRHEAVHAENQLVHETGARYIDFVVPGLLGMNLMGSAIWSLGFSIVEMRQKKLLKRMVASPMPRWQYLASFLLSRLLMLVIELVVFLGFAKIAFGVPFRGSLAQLALLCLLASLAFSALGLLVASRARTMEAASGLMNLVMLPMWILSGVFFSASRFPNIVQPIVRALPLTAAIDALRGNMLQGMSLPQLAVPVFTLMAWLVIPFFVALRIFRWR